MPVSIGPIRIVSLELTFVPDYQKTVSNMPLSWAGALRSKISGRKRKVQILNGIDGVLESGEMLVVLGPPGRSVTAGDL